MNDLVSIFDHEEPSHPAIEQLTGDPVDYGQLLEYAYQCGSSLRALSESATLRVAVVMPNGPLMATTFLCCAPWCAVAPLNPTYTVEEFEFYLLDLTPDLVLVQEGEQSPVLDVAKRLNIATQAIAAQNENPFDFATSRSSPVRRDLDATALILHTSGTTSRPKMVPLSQRNLIASARNIATTLKLTVSDRCLNVMPLFHIHGLIAPILASIYAGASVVCTPGFDALRFFGWLDSVRPTWFSAVPTMHQAILSRSSRNKEIARQSQLRFIRSSSASLPPQVLHKLEETFATCVVEAYAMTEAAHQMCSNPLPPQERKPGTVGPQAGPDVRIAAVDSIRFLDANEEGEVVIRGENVTSGYINNEEANSKDFQEGWFRTGDLGVMDEEGYLKITGRLKEIINRGGEKIAPLEVDEILLDHDAVEQACVFAIPHDVLGEDVGAIVVLKEGSTATVQEIRTFARERLSAFKVPRTILFLDEIPKGATGKVQRIGMAERLGLAGES